MSVLSHWLEIQNDVPPHLKSSLDRLSQEHCSGIALNQLDTPMMRQFRIAKEEVPDALLFFRMGDFYELFGADAIVASDVCGLTLTSRDKNSPSPIPMAGVPVVTYKNALKKCLDRDFKVAVCDQVENPKDAKGLVRREVTQIATPAVPGDLEDDGNQKKIFGCFLACAVAFQKKFVFSYVDISTADFRYTAQLAAEEFIQEILAVRPRELLVPGNQMNFVRTLFQNSDTDFLMKLRLTSMETAVVHSEMRAEELFNEFFPQDFAVQSGLLQAQGGIVCIAGLLAYLKKAQGSQLDHLNQIQFYDTKQYMVVDEATRKHLDYFITATGEKKGSFFHFLNRCHTAVGSRTLLRRLLYPFKEVELIEKSLDEIQIFIEKPHVMSQIGLSLGSVVDLHRILSRCAQKNIDLVSFMGLRKTLSEFFFLRKICCEHFKNTDLFCSFSQEDLFIEIEKLYKYLCEVFVEEINHGHSLEEGVRPGFHGEWDDILNTERTFQKQLDDLEKHERESAQLPQIKIGFTRNFGYYFEISKGRASQAPKHFVRKQTLTNAERFITPQLKELEEKFLTCTQRKSELQNELMAIFRSQILGYSDDLQRVNDLLGLLDCQLNFAQLAASHSWVRPHVTSDSSLNLRQSVHPVLKSLNRDKLDFVPNDVSIGGLNRGFIHLITGPNMSGKSTLMRQVCINQILCQMGSYVPAESATIGLCDRILSRIGSADFATKNQSTFMVEMLETAHLLRLATPQSLVILDEIGRGTSTYDGLALAWAIIEELHDETRARCFFSTHYHELVKVSEQKQGIMPMRMAVLENMSGGDVLFTRRYEKGHAEKSFGIFVAKKAGISERVLLRAQEILSQLEEPVVPVESGATLQGLPQFQTSVRTPRKKKPIEGDYTLFSP